MNEIKKSGRQVLRPLATLPTLFCPCLLAGLLLAGCGQSADQSASKQTLAEARQGFATRLLRKETADLPVPKPPPALFRSVTFPSPLGEMAAYVSTSPADGRKHPAIIWIAGGFDNSISEIAWEPGPPENDQSAIAFRDAGIVMMYPSLRGGNKNPGSFEGFFGEVEDVLAAADYLTKLDYVDSDRIYLGGHSTGGTLVLLVAESSSRFRAVFSFGPVADIRGYGEENLPFDLSDRQEVALRSPGKWLRGIQSPTYVFEGKGGRSNIGELTAMARGSRNKSVHFHPVKGGDHFSILWPVSRLIAAKILQDTETASAIAFTDKELAEALGK